ncbi:MAG: hypothetical protein M1832_000760 [Thelocarpon impressellum]|nr:MAG: hypothetical protein M1832_000760 [Thelocarpon impressellum]
MDHDLAGKPVLKSRDPSAATDAEQHPQASPQASPKVAPEDGPPGTEEAPQDIEQSIRPPFAPFFTLVEDGLTQAHHHPAVHYLFSDDDPEILTQAALRALSPRSEPPSVSSSALRRSGADAADADASTETSLTIPSRSRGDREANQAPRERYLVVDVAPSGDTITAARSLTADWQVLSVDVSSAPTWEGNGGEGAPARGGDSGLMLKIEGTGPPSTTEDGSKADGQEDLHELVAQFESRMATLRKVVEQAGREQPALAEDKPSAAPE